MSNLKAVETAPRTVTVQFRMNSEKKNSVRYDATGDDPGVTSAYVMKHALPKPYPQTFKMTLTFD